MFIEIFNFFFSIHFIYEDLYYNAINNACKKSYFFNNIFHIDHHVFYKTYSMQSINLSFEYNDDNNNILEKENILKLRKVPNNNSI